MTRLNAGFAAPDFTFDTPWEKNLAFPDISGGKPSVLVFLRYLGCPVCQMEMANFKRDIGLIESTGARLFIVLQSSAATIAGLTGKEAWPFTIICDPQGLIFQKYGVAAGGFLKYLHPAGLIAALKATLKGYMHGKFEGKETQLPAVFIITPERKIKYAYYGTNISDVPTPASIAARI